jgi:ribose/xylose/arabinose/galactoside ABC-type transport system permease subunit
MTSVVETPSRGRAIPAWARWRSNGINPGLLIALVVLFVALSILSPHFLSASNLLNIGKAISIVGVAAVGETIVIISGGFDLSIGSVMAAAAMFSAWGVTVGVPLPLAFIGSLVIGLVVGLANGTVISYARINPLITTLATLSIVRGISYVLSGGKDIPLTNETWLSLGSDSFLGVPIIVWILGATFLVFGSVMPRSLFGRYAYSIGSSARASRLAGVRVDRWRLAFYATCGVLAALAGLVTAGRVGYAQPSANAGIELDVITAVILGGTALTGGRGTLAGTLVGLLLLGVINNGLTLAGVQAFWQLIVKGLLLLAAVLYDERRRFHRDET